MLLGVNADTLLVTAASLSAVDASRTPRLPAVLILSGDTVPAGCQDLPFTDKYRADVATNTA
jgi:hypothetical protein